MWPHKNGTVTLHISVQRRAASDSLVSGGKKEKRGTSMCSLCRDKAPLWLLNVLLFLAGGHEAVFNAKDNKVLVAALRTLL